MKYRTGSLSPDRCNSFPGEISRQVYIPTFKFKTTTIQDIPSQELVAVKAAQNSCGCGRHCRMTDLGLDFRTGSPNRKKGKSRDTASFLKGW